MTPQNLNEDEGRNTSSAMVTAFRVAGGGKERGEKNNKAPFGQKRKKKSSRNK